MEGRDDGLAGVNHSLLELADLVKDVLGHRSDHVGREINLGVDSAGDEGLVLRPPVAELDDAQEPVARRLDHLAAPEVGRKRVELDLLGHDHFESARSVAGVEARRDEPSGAREELLRPPYDLLLGVDVLLGVHWLVDLRRRRRRWCRLALDEDRLIGCWLGSSLALLCRGGGLARSPAHTAGRRGVSAREKSFCGMKRRDQNARVFMRGACACVHACVGGDTGRSPLAGRRLLLPHCRAVQWCARFCCWVSWWSVDWSFRVLRPFV